MAKIANVALTNTFDFWRTQSNIAFDRMSQFAINNSRLYANTVVANNVLKSLGNTVIGASGKRAVVNGLLSANGRMTISTNLDVTGNTSANKATVTSSLTVSGNTSTNKATVTSALTVSGNTTLGAAGKTITSTGAISHTGTQTISTNLTVSGNTSTNKATVTSSLTVSGNTTLGAAGKTITSTGAASHTGTKTISTNLTVSGNTSLSAGASNTFVNFNGARLSNFSEFANTAINTGSAKTVSNDTNFVRYTVSAGCTITLPTNSGNPGASPAVKSVVLFLKQNGTGGYAVTLAAPAGGTIKYNNSASQPAVNTGANKVTIYSCMKFDNDNTWYVSQSFIDA